jgi:hypothetical protein
MDLIFLDPGFSNLPKRGSLLGFERFSILIRFFPSNIFRLPSEADRIIGGDDSQHNPKPEEAIG